VRVCCVCGCSFCGCKQDGKRKEGFEDQGSGQGTIIAWTLLGLFCRVRRGSFGVQIISQ
jgi:hypothetical protein